MQPQAGRAAGNDDSYQAALLKAASFRVTSTPVEQLPVIVPSICAQLASCKELLSSPQDALSRSDADPSTHIKRLKTRISSLLQDRSPEARWAATVLAKVAVECGGLAVLRDSLPWVRGLLGVLNRPDSSTTKRLAITTLTRIFLLTQGNQTLVREITTPNLPSLVTLCCQLLNNSPDLADTTLQALSRLVSHHPAIFRPYVNQLRQILSQYVAPTSPQALFTAATIQSAQRLFTQLHGCAPKNNGSAEWATNFKRTLTCVHGDVDQIFRSVLEDWESTSGYHPIRHSVQVLDTEPARLDKNAIGIGTWLGLEQGSRVVIGQLGLLRSYLATPTSFPTSIDASAFTDLATRLMSLVRPAQVRDWDATGRANPQFDRKERESLALLLPELHVAVLKTTHTFLSRLGTSLPELKTSFLDRLPWMFQSECSEVLLREAIYEGVAELLPYVGPSLDKDRVSSLSKIAAHCCQDLLAGNMLNDPSTHLAERKSTGLKIDSFESHAPRGEGKGNSSAYAAASRLLPILLGTLKANSIPRQMRAEMDRAAVLSRHKAALMASVQNASVQQASLLPLLARILSHDLDVQALLKPRMPVILQAVESLNNAADEQDVNGAPDDNAPVGRLYQAAYDMSNVDARARPNVDHLFPVESNSQIESHWSASTVPQVESSAFHAPKDTGLIDADSRKRSSDADLLNGSVKRPRGGHLSSRDIDVDEANDGSIGQSMGAHDDPTPIPTAAGNNDFSMRDADSDINHPGTQHDSATGSGAVASGVLPQQQDDDSDDEDFVMPQLHFRSESDDDEAD